MSDATSTSSRMRPKSQGRPMIKNARRPTTTAGIGQPSVLPGLIAVTDHLAT